MFSSTSFYGKDDSPLDHLKEKTLIVSFCEKAACTLAISMLIGSGDLLEN